MVSYSQGTNVSNQANYHLYACPYTCLASSITNHRNLGSSAQNKEIHLLDDAAGQYSCYLNWRYNQVSVAKGPLFDDMLLLLGMKVRFHVENVLPRPVD